MGPLLCTAGFDKRIDLWHTDTLERRGQLEGTLVLLGFLQKFIRSSFFISKIGHEDGVLSLCFVPQSRDSPLWSTSADFSVRRWEVAH